MCRICVTPDRIEEIERRHNVRWCWRCATYISRELAVCPTCAERVREAKTRLGITRRATVREATAEEVIAS